MIRRGGYLEKAAIVATCFFPPYSFGSEQISISHIVHLQPYKPRREADRVEDPGAPPGFQHVIILPIVVSFLYVQVKKKSERQHKEVGAPDNQDHGFNKPVLTPRDIDL